MNRLLIIGIIGLLSCAQASPCKAGQAEHQERIAKKIPAAGTVGESIQGDFEGDGVPGIATAVRIKEGAGNLAEDGTPDDYEIQFSAAGLQSIDAGCCEIRLINEGDLDEDGGDELSLFQAPMNGCTHTMTTYSRKHGAWKQLIRGFLVPTACTRISDADLQERIFREKTVVYFLDANANDEGGRLVRKKAVVE